jgi:CO/xanthine dehydrogenase Mo-binding subunit
VTATENPTYTWVGTRPIRHDGYDKVVGKARFAADLDLPGQLHTAYLRSPHPHARILSIDTDAAAAMPGVRAVVTGADFPDLDPMNPNFDVSVNVMARDVVPRRGPRPGPPQRRSTSNTNCCRQSSASTSRRPTTPRW